VKLFQNFHYYFTVKFINWHATGKIYNSINRLGHAVPGHALF